MSKKIIYDKLTEKDITNITKTLTIEIPPKFGYGGDVKILTLFSRRGNTVSVPFAYDILSNFQGCQRPEREHFSQTNVKFTGKLREQQIEIKNQAVEGLNKYGCFLAGLPTGFGKTVTALYLACMIRLKTLILCNRIVLIKQWQEEIKSFCSNATVQVLSSSSEMENVDFYIINAQNITKKDISFYSNIGLVIVDEAHLILAEKLSKCLFSLYPRYLIGLSATPYRMDGLNVLFDQYFGPCKIVRELHRKHTVYRIDTGITPEVKLNRMGKVDWGSVIDSQCNNVKRNDFIIRILQHFKDRTFIVLCKRVEQANYLYDKLTELKESVTSLVGKKQTYEDKRILIGTTGKAGTGFSKKDLDALILASDIEQYFIQYLGRVFRTETVEPLIFDLVDINPILEKHWKTRKATYLKHGGVIKNFCEEFRKFKI